jgi:hypothetical protein
MTQIINKKTGLPKDISFGSPAIPLSADPLAFRLPVTRDLALSGYENPHSYKKLIAKKVSCQIIFQQRDVISCIY